MQPEIRKLCIEDEFFTEELCHITELSNTDNDTDASIARARVEPGIATHWHKLDGIVERYVILEGEGLVEIGELEPTALKPGDVVIIPAMCRQRITNTGQTDLIFLAICTPRFRQEAYIAPA